MARLPAIAMIKTPLSFSLATLLLVAACSKDSDATSAVAERKYQLDRVDNTIVVQLYADGFEALSLNDKMLAYHLSQAAIAGRDIYLDQRFEFTLPLRWVLTGRRRPCDNARRCAAACGSGHPRSPRSRLRPTTGRTCRCRTRCPARAIHGAAEDGRRWAVAASINSFLDAK